MLENSWFKKEKPFAGFAGFGGGVGSNLVAGGPDGPIQATGGTTNDYTDPAGDWKSHTFTAPGPFNVTNIGNPTSVI